MNRKKREKKVKQMLECIYVRTIKYRNSTKREQCREVRIAYRKQEEEQTNRRIVENHKKKTKDVNQYCQ